MGTLGHAGKRSGGDFGHFRDWVRSLPDLELKQGGVPSFEGPRRRPGRPSGPLLARRWCCGSWGGGPAGCGGGVGGRWFRFGLPGAGFRRLPETQEGNGRVAEPRGAQCDTCLEP
jgi:hypothetical protein